MLTIALNEYGDFHHLRTEEKDLKNVHFIAGIVYDDEGNENDTYNEQERLDRFFRAVANEVGSSYPSDFFAQLKRDDEDIEDEANRFDKKSMAIFRRAIDKHLPEFLSKGTFKGQQLIPVERKGGYSITGIMKSRAGKSFYLDPAVSNMLRDDVASNLYWHMADSLVSRLLFTNPYSLYNDTVRLHLASQIIEVKESETDKIKEFIQLGYKQYEPENERMQKKAEKHELRFYQVGNDFTYRAAMDRHSIERHRTDLAVEDFRVISLDYDGPEHKETHKNAFLYLAGHIVGNFIYYVTNREEHRKGSDIGKFTALCKFTDELNYTRHNLLFAYDDMDTYYEQAMTQYLDGDYVASLTTLYHARACESKFRDYYLDNWFPYIEAQIHSSTDLTAIEQAVLAFTQYANQNRIDVGLLNYLYSHLQEIIGDVDVTMNRQLVYDFYDAGMTAFNHLGKSSDAAACFAQCQSMVEQVPLEQYLLTLKRRIVGLVDTYEYDKALELAHYVADCEVKLQALRIEVNVLPSNMNLAQAYSQLGQVYAYMQSDEAPQWFYKALDIFEPTSADYYRTLSYLLHYFIDSGNKEKYETFAPRYFGQHQTVDDQLRYFWDMTDSDKTVQLESYALYVYVKALYTFYLETVSETTIKTLIGAVKASSDSDSLQHTSKGHPWELIYMYMALITQKRILSVQDITLVPMFDRYMDLAVHNPGPAIQNIISYGHMRIADVKGDAVKSEQWKTELESRIGDIDTHMTYMFR